MSRKADCNRIGVRGDCRSRDILCPTYAAAQCRAHRVESRLWIGSAGTCRRRCDRIPKTVGGMDQPHKNQMNEIWDPMKADGVNYYMFAGPRNWFQPYSERSDPRSLYYQAWAGGYVIRMRDGTLPADLQSLAWQVTALDQRSWLSTMGKSCPESRTVCSYKCRQCRYRRAHLTALARRYEKSQRFER